MSKDLRNKVAQAISLLCAISDVKPDIELCYSGGKDSDVILELAKMANIPFTAIYKNTTIDPSGTIEHCRKNGVQIVEPEYTFFELIESKGFPTRRARFCCEKLKEYKIKDTAILGIRREESTARAKRYIEPTICRVYGKTSRVEQVLPILNWTLRDVCNFINERNITVAPYYYKLGTPDYTKRLGCIGCPLASDNGISDFKDHPKMLAKWIKHGQIYLDTHPNVNAHSKFGDACGMMAHNLFFKNYSQFEAASISLFGKPDWKQYLMDYFKIDL